MVLVLFLTRFSCVSDPHTTTTLLRLRYLYLQLQLQFILLHLKFQFKRNKHTRTRTQSEHDMERIENDKTVNAAYDSQLICLFISFHLAYWRRRLLLSSSPLGRYILPYLRCDFFLYSPIVHSLTSNHFTLFWISLFSCCCLFCRCLELKLQLILLTHCDTSQTQRELKIHQNIIFLCLCLLLLICCQSGGI